MFTVKFEVSLKKYGVKSDYIKYLCKFQLYIYFFNIIFLRL